MTMTTLDQWKLGAKGSIADVSMRDVVGQRLLALGILPGASVEVVGLAPLGDPMAILVDGQKLSLRRAEAALVSVVSS